jgi:hypothetical protein
LNLISWRNERTCPAEDCDRIVEYADVESARQEAEERIANEQRKHAANHDEPPASKGKKSPVAEEAGGESVDNEVVKGESGAAEQVAGHEELAQSEVETVPPRC